MVARSLNVAIDATMASTGEEVLGRALQARREARRRRILANADGRLAELRGLKQTEVKSIDKQVTGVDASHQRQSAFCQEPTVLVRNVQTSQGPASVKQCKDSSSEQEQCLKPVACTHAGRTEVHLSYPHRVLSLCGNPYV